MTMFRIAVIAAAALGVTWAAEQVVQSAVQDGVPVMTQVDTASPQAGGQSPAPAPAADEQSEPAEIPELSDAEMEAELARIEAAVAGGDADDLEEFTPSKPLAADLAIALPSDI